MALMFWFTSINQDALDALAACDTSSPPQAETTSTPEAIYTLEFYINGHLTELQQSDEHPSKTQKISDVVQRFASHTRTVIRPTVALWYGNLSAQFEMKPPGCPPEANPATLPDEDRSQRFSISCPLDLTNCKKSKDDLQFARTDNVSRTSFLQFISKEANEANEAKAKWTCQLFLRTHSDIPRPQPSGKIVVHSIPVNKEERNLTASDYTVVCTLEEFDEMILDFAVPRDNAKHYTMWSDRVVIDVVLLTWRLLMGYGGFFNVLRMQDAGACQNDVVFTPGGGMLFQRPVGWKKHRRDKDLEAFKKRTAFFQQTLFKTFLGHTTLHFESDGYVVTIGPEQHQQDQYTVYTVLDAVFRTNTHSEELNEFVFHMLRCAANLQNCLLQNLFDTVCYKDASEHWQTQMPVEGAEERRQDRIAAAEKIRMQLLAYAEECDKALRCLFEDDNERNRVWFEITNRMYDDARDSAYHSIGELEDSVKRMKYKTFEEAIVTRLLERVSTLIKRADIDRGPINWIKKEFNN